MDQSPEHTSPEAAVTTPVDVVRSEERLRYRRVPELTKVVRVGKRVVTEEQTVTVTCRREELVVEEAPAARVRGRALTGRADTGAGDAAAPVLELVFYAEVVETVTRVVPVERVRVYRDTVASSVEMDDVLAHEEIELIP